jgi:hypothetical protein
MTLHPRSTLTAESIAADVRRKIGTFAQRTDDRVINSVVAEPLANILASGPTFNVDLAVENFLSNSELFNNFTQVKNKKMFYNHSGSMSIPITILTYKVSKNTCRNFDITN